MRGFPKGPTWLTVLWVSESPNNLQSLLDTTPPKRVPILWDGSAPAPSTGTDRAAGAEQSAAFQAWGELSFFAGDIFEQFGFRALHRGDVQTFSFAPSGACSFATHGLRRGLHSRRKLFPPAEKRFQSGMTPRFG